MKLKYIYYEIYRVTGSNPVEPKIQNANSLLFKPDTNSMGMGGFLNMTERHGFSKKTCVSVDQRWVDLDKYKFNVDSAFKRDDHYVKECIALLNEKLKLL